MQDTTIAIQYGYEKDTQKTMNIPIYMTTAYEFRDSEHAADLFNLKELGNIYTRLTNPTTNIFEKRFAKLENGVMAVATASGMSAIFGAILNVAEAGDNIIISNALYGGTTTLCTHTIKRLGIRAKVFDATNPTNLKDLIDEKTKLILFESISNPSLKVAEFKEIVKIAKKHKILTLVDNTVATPILCKPIDYGIDLVVHSTSKYTNGNGSALGGIVVEAKSAKEIILNNPRYYHFNEPDISYHGLIYSKLPYPPFCMRYILAILRDIGQAPSPFNSWLMLQGLETISLRVNKHSLNALKIAKFLLAHPKVKKVNYPFLESDENYIRAKKYLKGGGGLLSFEVSSYEEAFKIANNTKIFSVVVNIGDSKSLIIHPASTTHQQLSKEELKNSGISDSLIRLSIGIEDSDDLIKDLEGALN